MKNFKKLLGLVLVFACVLAIGVIAKPAKQTSAFTVDDMAGARVIKHIGKSADAETVGAVNLQDVKYTYYRILVPRKMDVTISVSGAYDFSKRIFVKVYGEDGVCARGNEESRTNWVADGDYYSVDKFKKRLKAGYYYIEIMEYYTDPGMKYTVETSGVIAKKTAEIKSVVKKKAGVTRLTWKKITDVKGYEIYRCREKNGHYEHVKTISNNERLTWKDTTCEEGKVYYYKIRGYWGNGNKRCFTKFSNIVKVKA